MTEHSSNVAALVDALGGFIGLHFDDRTELPIAEQVRRLMEWACSQRPEPFRRSVPVSPYDHDVLITQALTKLVMEVERLRRERATALESVAWRADWMTRAVNLLGDLRDTFEDAPGWDEHAETLDDLLAEEFDDGEEANDG